jgi:zinc transporter
MTEHLFVWPSADAPVWRHTRVPLGEPSPFPDLPEDVWEAMSAPETRPRYARLEGGHLLVLRGVNVNPGNQPEDMVSLRLWLGPKGLASISIRRVFAIEDAERALEEGRLSPAPLSIMLFIAEELGVRIRDAILAMDETAQSAEETLLAHNRETRIGELQENIRKLRRRAVWLRRHLAPQRAALSDFRVAAGPQMDQDLIEDFNEVINEAQRAAEAVQSLAEYGAVLQDQVEAIRDAQMARTSYILGLVAAVFLPLNLLAAIFGANVGGIPWAEHGNGFIYLSVLCLVIAAATAWLLRRR